MQSEKQNLGEEYALRAIEDPEPPVSSISIPKIREARDMVYNGTSVISRGETGIHDTASAPRNKKHYRRKISPFTVIVILLGVAFASVLYIGNILAVGRLMAHINQLQIKHQQIINNQELLKVQINRLSSLERIHQIAGDQLGLQSSKQLPVWIEENPDRAQQVEEIVQQQSERMQ